MQRTINLQTLVNEQEFKAIQEKVIQWAQSGKGRLSLSEMLRTMATQIPVEQIPASTKSRRKLEPPK